MSIHETRSARISAGGKGDTFDALALSYNRLDDYSTVFLPGCASAALNRRLPAVTFSHDWADPIGKISAWRDTVLGPEVTGRLDVGPDVPRARQAAAQLRSGTLSDVSIGFVTKRTHAPSDAEEQRWPGVVKVYDEIDIDEVALCLRGAVPGAEVLSVRSRMDRDLRDGRITPAQHRAWEQLVDETGAGSRMSEAEARAAMAHYAEKRSAAAAVENERRSREFVERDAAIEREHARRAAVDPIDRLLGL